MERFEPETLVPKKIDGREIETLKEGTECIVEIEVRIPQKGYTQGDTYIEFADGEEEYATDTLRVETTLISPLLGEKLPENKYMSHSSQYLLTGEEVIRNQILLNQFKKDVFDEFGTQLSDRLEEIAPDEDLEETDLGELLSHSDFSQAPEALELYQQYDIIIHWERRKVEARFIRDLLKSEYREQELQEILRNFKTITLNKKN
jgi:hypothetical protein